MDYESGQFDDYHNNTVPDNERNHLSFSKLPIATSLVGTRNYSVKKYMKIESTSGNEAVGFLRALGFPRWIVPEADRDRGHRVEP